jgi:hypothetical protein
MNILLKYVKFYKNFLIFSFLTNNFFVLKGQTLLDWANSCFSHLQEYAVNTKSPTRLTTIIRNDTLSKLIDNVNSRLFNCPKTDFYVQKLVVNNNSKIFIMGDIHGSIHSLLRNLLRLFILGYLDNNFRLIKDNTYIVFLGDYQSLGRYGTEVWYTILTTVANNDPNRIILLRGNHESTGVADSFGFLAELTTKYKTYAQAIKGKLSALWHHLPLALFLGCNGNYAQFCHGGIDPKYNPKALLDGPNTLELIRGDYTKSGLMEGYFCQYNPSFHGRITHCAGHTFRPLIDTLALANFLSNPANGYTNVKVFFRGHQHSYYGCKMFLKEPREKLELSSRTDDKFDSQYPLAWWQRVLKHYHPILISSDGFQIINYGPVYTLSTAPEGASYPDNPFNYDCLGILTVGQNFEDWRFIPYEISLGETHKRDQKFVTCKICDAWRSGTKLIDITEAGEININDCLEVSWGNTPGSCVIEENQLSKALLVLKEKLLTLAKSL